MGPAQKKYVVRNLMFLMEAQRKRQKLLLKAEFLHEATMKPSRPLAVRVGRQPSVRTVSLTCTTSQV